MCTELYINLIKFYYFILHVLTLCMFTELNHKLIFCFIRVSPCWKVLIIRSFVNILFLYKIITFLLQLDVKYWLRWTTVGQLPVRPTTCSGDCNTKFIRNASRSSAEVPPTLQTRDLLIVRSVGVEEMTVSSCTLVFLVYRELSVDGFTFGARIMPEECDVLVIRHFNLYRVRETKYFLFFIIFGARQAASLHFPLILNSQLPPIDNSASFCQYMSYGCQNCCYLLMAYLSKQDKRL
jgi:hypothetical protein